MLAVGRLVPHKRLDVAIRAVAALTAGMPDVPLVIAGTGYAEPELRALVADSASSSTSSCAAGSTRTPSTV